MILFASGRCDICAYYSEWLMNRINEGFVDVRNPFNEHAISRIFLNSSQIDCIIFCTKNPIPMLQYIEQLKQFPLIFHITLTAYHQDIERNVFDKKQIIQAIKTLSQMLGKEHVIVRYDPIILNQRYTISYHQQAFERICQELHDDVSKIIISFVDMYKNTENHAKEMNMEHINEEKMNLIGQLFGEIASQYQIKVQTCAEKIDLSQYGIKKGLCFDKKELEQLVGHELNNRYGVRKACACMESVDIGDYNCCGQGCLYCYANYDEKKIAARMKMHDPKSSVLLGHINDTDEIHIRKEKIVKQIYLLNEE